MYEILQSDSARYDLKVYVPLCFRCILLVMTSTRMGIKRDTALNGQEVIFLFLEDIYVSHFCGATDTPVSTFQLI